MWEIKVKVLDLILLILILPWEICSCLSENKSFETKTRTFSYVQFLCGQWVAWVQLADSVHTRHFTMVQCMSHSRQTVEIMTFLRQFLQTRVTGIQQTTSIISTTWNWRCKPLHCSCSRVQPLSDCIKWRVELFQVTETFVYRRQWNQRIINSVDNNIEYV